MSDGNSMHLDFSEEDLNKLGLNEHPFTEHAGDNYLYTDSQLDMTSNIIMEYLGNPTTTIVLTGEEGLGKTTFLRKVLRIGYQQYQFCTLRAGSSTSFDDVEQKIKQRWVISEPTAVDQAELSIENHVITYLREHQNAVLIIDDAEHLDLPTLDRLFTLKHRVALACPNGLGLILAGESQLVTYISELEESNPACTQVYQINVRPLTREQTTGYIRSRLNTAGQHDDMLLDEFQLDAIYESTSGNIKLIHETTTDVLLALLTEDDPANDILDENIIIRKPKSSRTPIFIAALVLVLGAGAYLYSQQQPAQVDEIALPILAPEPALEAPTVAEPVIQEESEVAPIKKAVVEALPEVFNELEPLEEPENKIAESPTNLAAEAKVVEKQQEESVQENTTKALETPNFGKPWLKSLAATNYTLQVIATSELKRLEDLVEKENLSTEFALFEKDVKGQTYHVLVVGNFASREEASSSVQKLSASLRKNNPWPIKLSQVQQHLK